MDTASINVPNIVPGAGGSQIIGPFPWTPSQLGHECVIVICECANDRAITQDLLATDHVSHANLVPFDNNIAQRNIFPTAAKGTTKRGFYIGNPDPERRSTIAVDVVRELPPGWRWQSTLPDDNTIELGPGERRWIDVTIDQADGRAVTAFDRPYRLIFTGTVEGRAIGGVTFYVAPPGTIPEDREGEVHTHHHGDLHDLLDVHIPWEDCEIEGELTLHLKFRHHK